MAFAVVRVSDNGDPVGQCAWSILRDIEDEEVIADLVTEWIWRMMVRNKLRMAPRTLI